MTNLRKNLVRCYKEEIAHAHHTGRELTLIVWWVTKRPSAEHAAQLPGVARID